MRVHRPTWDVDVRGILRDADRTKTTGFVSEIFCSIQGEGIYLGERQVFFRVAGCSATCSWCDTVSSKKERSVCLVHGPEKHSIENPMSARAAIEAIVHLIDVFSPVRTVSLTGGEPLEQAEFVAEVAETLRRHGARIYLETSGLEVDGLRLLRAHSDVVAMDIKLPSATGHVHWDVHREFIKWLVGTDFFVKIVVDDTTPMSEIEEAVHLIAEIDRDATLVFQPESKTLLKESKGPEPRRRLVELLESSQRMALNNLTDVRVIPQCHRMLKVR